MAKLEGDHQRFRSSYRASMMVAFAMVAATTAAITIIVVWLVFGAYFASYTSDNMKSVASFAAERISEEYSYVRSMGSVNYNLVMENLQLGEDAGLMVLDTNGNTLYDSSASAGTAEGKGEGPGSASQVAIAAVTHGGEDVGSVRIWIYGSDVLMSRPDIAFRDNMYQSLFMAGGFAVIIAMLIGLWFSRSLMRPIRKISAAAQEISQGNLAARTGLQGGNELSRLGQQFDVMAESIERDRDMEMQLTSDVAHELRTPLMAIQATVEAMIDGVYDTDPEHLALVDGEVRRLSRLVDALLKLSRLERRSQPMNEEVNDIGELVDAVVTSHEVLVQDSGLQIEAHTGKPVKAVCDKDLIKQAVANLISNAVRYTPEGGRIDVYVREEDGWAVIDVEDTGIGMTPEEEKMVFSRFWRADSDRGRKSGGLGIGLSVVKEIVSQHKGQIAAKGEKGVGSTFTIMIPAYDEDASRKQARAAMRAFEMRQRPQKK